MIKMTQFMTYTAMAGLLIAALAFEPQQGIAQGGPPGGGGAGSSLQNRVERLEQSLESEIVGRIDADNQEAANRVLGDDALQARIAILETALADAKADILAEVADRVAQDGQLQANIDGVANSLDLLPGPFSSYTNSAAFAAAAGATADVDFSQLPAGDQSYAELTLSGVTFRNFRSYYQQAIYRAHVTHGPIEIDLPPGTRAVAADVSSFYGDPGQFTIALSTGQETTTTSDSGFIGVVSEKPMDSVTIRFYSDCIPAVIYGDAPCPTFPVGYLEGVTVIRNVTFGPGPGI